MHARKRPADNRPPPHNTPRGIHMTIPPAGSPFPVPTAPPMAPTVFPPPDAAVATWGLTRSFGNKVAVNGLNLVVRRGEFFGFLGPNGAGKSTTIKMLTGLLAPTAGSIQILGLDALANPIEVKRQIGVVPEGLALFGRLTAAEYLHFVGRMYGLDAATTAARTEELLDFMSLANETKKLITDFSHGMQKKLALAAAVIHGPKVLFLDEPFEGVDAIASGTLKAMLQGMIARGATIFLTSHVLEIVERLCTHIAIIDRGRLIANGSLEDLRAGVQARSTDSNGSQTLTLEQIFLSIVGSEPGAQQPEQELSWLG
jgi:ABC-2 type transport system ATP-binding protein